MLVLRCVVGVAFAAKWVIENYLEVWFWPAVAGPSQAIWPRLGAHASPYAWAAVGRGNARSLLYLSSIITL